VTRDPWSDDEVTAVHDFEPAPVRHCAVYSGCTRPRLPGHAVCELHTPHALHRIATRAQLQIEEIAKP
jgi:hypothetical protein